MLPIPACLSSQALSKITVLIMPFAHWTAYNGSSSSIATKQNPASSFWHSRPFTTWPTFTFQFYVYSPCLPLCNPVFSSTIQHSCFGVRILILQFLTVWPWASYLTRLNFSFLSCQKQICRDLKNELIVSAYSQTYAQNTPFTGPAALPISSPSKLSSNPIVHLTLPHSPQLQS